jgi:hypothetical protein
MPDPQDAPDLYEQLPDVDPGDVAGEDAADAADTMHDEVDSIAQDADPDGLGHGSSAPESERR